MDDLPEGAIEVVLDEDTRAPGPPPSSGAGTGALPADGETGGNRAGYDQRISQLVARRHDAERGQDAERERADRLERELAATRTHLASLDQRQQATDQHVQNDLAARERAIKQHEADGKVQRLTVEKANALETGDYAKVASLDVEINDALLDRREFGRDPATGSRPQAQQQQRTEQAAGPQVDENMRAFQARNADWWQKDAARTATAWEVHAQIKARSPEAVGRPEYYRQIEAAVARRHDGGGAPPALSGGGGANGGGTSISNVGGKQRVVLSKDDVEHARRMGLTPAEWADGVRMMHQRGETAGQSDARRF